MCFGVCFQLSNSELDNKGFFGILLRLSVTDSGFADFYFNIPLWEQ